MKRWILVCTGIIYGVIAISVSVIELWWDNRHSKLFLRV